MSAPTVVDLTWAVGMWGTGTVPSLTLVSPGCDTENHFVPAQTVLIYGEKNIAALRDFLLLHLSPTTRP